MLNHVSWTNYLAFIIIILIGYYTIILLRYCQGDIRNMLLGGRLSFRRIIRSNKPSTEIQAMKTCNNEQSDEDHLLAQIAQFKVEITHIFEEAAENNLIKQEVIFSLQRLAKKYSQIKASSYLTSVNNYILIESSNYSSVQLNESDIHGVWVYS